MHTTHTTGFTLANDYGHIPGLRGPTFDKRGSNSPPRHRRSASGEDLSSFPQTERSNQQSKTMDSFNSS